MAATTKAYPPNGTFFSTVKSFADVPVDKEHDNKIGTTAFLEAAESLTTLFGGFFGGGFFSSPLLILGLVLDSFWEGESGRIVWECGDG